MEVYFKEATIDYVSGIVSLGNDCFDEMTSISYAKQMMEQAEGDKNQIYLVGMIDKEIVAHACYKDYGFEKEDAFFSKEI